MCTLSVVAAATTGVAAAGRKAAPAIVPYQCLRVFSNRHQPRRCCCKIHHTAYSIPGINKCSSSMTCRLGQRGHVSDANDNLVTVAIQYYSTIQYFRAILLETMLYGCVTWSPRACHYDTLRGAHQRFLTRCIGWRKHNRADHPISYLDTLNKTRRESIEETLRRRRILSAGFVARMEDTRLPKCVMFGEMVGGAGRVGQEKEWMGCFLDDLRAFGINADQWTAAAQDEGERRRTAGYFMAKLIAAEKARAGLLHAVICPNVTGRTKEWIARSKRARAGSLAFVD